VEGGREGGKRETGRSDTDFLIGWMQDCEDVYGDWHANERWKKMDARFSSLAGLLRDDE
jgi:hypothetical protein